MTLRIYVFLAEILKNDRKYISVRWSGTWKKLF